MRITSPQRRSTHSTNRSLSGELSNFLIGLAIPIGVSLTASCQTGGAEDCPEASRMEPGYYAATSITDEVSPSVASLLESSDYLIADEVLQVWYDAEDGGRYMVEYQLRYP